MNMKRFVLFFSLIMSGLVLIASAQNASTSNSLTGSNGLFCQLSHSSTVTSFLPLIEVGIIVVAGLTIVIQYFRLTSAKMSVQKGESTEADLAKMSSEATMAFIGAGIVIAVVIAIAAIVPVLLCNGTI